MIAVFESEPALADMCPPDGVTMLHRAAQYGLLRVAKWLLDHGADVNQQSQPDFWRWKGRTPLEFAVWECAADSGRSACEAMAALLIERGAELTPLAAAALGRWDYLASCPLDSLQGKAVLQAAVRGDRPDVLRRLLEHGSRPERADADRPARRPDVLVGRPAARGGQHRTDRHGSPAARARRRSERLGVHLGLADRCGL